MVLVEGTTMVNVGEAGDTTATSVTTGEGMTVKEGAAGVGGDEMTVTNAHHPAQVVGVAGSQQTAICFSSSEEVLGKPHAMACPYSLMQAFQPFHCTTRHWTSGSSFHVDNDGLFHLSKLASGNLRPFASCRQAMA
mmetsp:Transcript_29408/g.55489  ORF Transcript_29408/g.55489 Transcript_29408/m.55489 type:complete len:136 (+) Transcript_29408:632-1039(+)